MDKSIEYSFRRFILETLLMFLILYIDMITINIMSDNCIIKLGKCNYIKVGESVKKVDKDEYGIVEQCLSKRIKLTDFEYNYCYVSFPKYKEMISENKLIPVRGY